jgi:hypothetical protein
MKNTLSDQLRYSMRIEWSNEDQVFVASLPEWGDLVHTYGATYEEALQRGKDLIERRSSVERRQFSVREYLCARSPAYGARRATATLLCATTRI